MITGTVFLLAVLLIALGNYVLLSSPDNGRNVRIDSVYNAAVDAQRALAADKDNALSDSLSDVANYVGNCSSFDPANLNSKAYTYFDNTVSAMNSALSSRGLSLASSYRTVSVTPYIGSDTQCNFSVKLDARFVVSAGSDAQKTVTMSSTKYLVINGPYNFRIIDNQTGRTDIVFVA